MWKGMQCVREIQRDAKRDRGRGAKNDGGQHEIVEEELFRMQFSAFKLDFM